MRPSHASATITEPPISRRVEAMVATPERPMSQFSGETPKRSLLVARHRLMRRDSKPHYAIHQGYFFNCSVSSHGPSCRFLLARI